MDPGPSSPRTDSNPSGDRFRPRWWTDVIEESWQRARTEAMAGWIRLHGLGSRVREAVAGDAVALGHGARRRFPGDTWEGDLESRVKDEWVANGPVDSPWVAVRVAVHHGWEHAGPPRGTPRRRW